MTAENPPRANELSSILMEKRTRLESTLNGYFATESFMEQGGYVWAAVKRLSSLDWIRSKVLRPALQKLDDQEHHLRRLEEGLGRRRQLLEGLEKQSNGVGTKDVMFHEPERVSQLMAELRDEALRYDRYEAAELVPFIVSSVDPADLARLGDRAKREGARHITHPHPDEEALHHLGPVGSTVAAFGDWLDDLGQHPDDTIEGKGQQGN